MTVTISKPPTADETTEILRFLHRFADLMSTGSNSDNLLRAARMLQGHVDRLKETEALLQVERVRGDAGAETRKALETRISEFESEIVALKSELSEQELHARMVVAEMAARQNKLQQRAEEVEVRLAEIESAPPAIPFGSIAVPLVALRLARGQFESLAASFEKSGDIVSRVMCEASASSLERVILDSGVAESEEHAA